MECPPPSLGTMVHASDSCIITLYTAAMIINDITADLNTTKHLAVLTVEWLLYVNCYIPPNQQNKTS